MVIGTITGDTGVVIGGGAGGKSSGGITGVGAAMSCIGGPTDEGDGEVGTLAEADVPPKEAFFSNRVSNASTRSSMTVEVSSRPVRWSAEGVDGEAIQTQAWGNIMANRTKPQAPRQLAAVKV